MQFSQVSCSRVRLLLCAALLGLVGGAGSDLAVSATPGEDGSVTVRWSPVRATSTYRGE